MPQTERIVSWQLGNGVKKLSKCRIVAYVDKVEERIYMLTCNISKAKLVPINRSILDHKFDK